MQSWNDVLHFHIYYGAVRVVAIEFAGVEYVFARLPRCLYPLAHLGR